MKITAPLLSVLLTLILWPQTATTQAQQKPEELAQKSAEAWLALTDSGKYADSWDQASSAFKAKVSRSMWVDQLTAVRGPFGKVVSRKLTAAQYKKSPPGAPEGEYVVVQYATNFENKSDSVETVSLMLDKDTKWRTVGYFIK
jgi:hypothetical protein